MDLLDQLRRKAEMPAPENIPQIKTVTGPIDECDDVDRRANEWIARLPRDVRLARISTALAEGHVTHSLVIEVPRGGVEP